MSVKPFVFYSDRIQYKSTQTESGTRYFVEGHISTGDIDLVNDIVTPGCMKSMYSQFDGRSIKLDFEHETFRGKSQIESEVNKTRIPLGKAINRKLDEKGLSVEWELNPTWRKFDEKGNITMTFNELWKNVEGGFYDAFSIAYVPTKTAPKEVNGTNARLLDDLNLLNVALTGNPVNPGASMTAVMAKSLEYMNDIDTKSNTGDNVAEEKKETTEQKSVSTENVDMVEVKSAIGTMQKEIAEVKSISAQMAEMKSGLAEVQELAKEMKSVLEMARPKGNGAEQKAQETQKTQVKSLSQLF